MNNEFKGLRHYINIVESAQQVDEEGVLNALGQLGGAVAGTAKNAVTGAYDAVKKGVTGAVDAAGNAISSAVQPVVQGAQAVAQGAKQGYATSQGAPAPAAGQAANPTKKPAAPAKPAAAAAPAAGKSDPNVLALQQKLIAAGAKIKADGIMGPATRAAQAQFPNVTTQTDAEKAVAADLNSAEKGPAAGQAANPTAAPAAAAPAAPAGMTAVGDDEGNTTITRPDGSTMVVGADGKQIMPGSNPNLPQNKGVFNTIKNAATGQGDFQKPTGFIPPATNLAVKESTGYDEIQRIVSLVHYK